MSRLASFRINDAVLTEVAYGYTQAESCLPFIAPTVNVNSRSGKIIQFGKEQFAVSSTKRSPYAMHKRSKVSGYGTANFVLEQHTKAAEVAWEEIEEAEQNGCSGSGIDLKELAVLDAVERIAQSLESELFKLITTPGNYEPTNSVIVSAANKFTNPGSDPEALVRNWKSAVRKQIGAYPNKAVISEDVYNALSLHPIFRDRAKYTSMDAIDLDLIAAWLGLPGGIRVCQRLQLNPVTGALEDMFPAGTMVLFIDGTKPQGTRGATTEANQPLFKQLPGVSRATATFAQLYVLNGGIRVGAERVDEDNDTIVNTVRFDGAIVLPSVGDTLKSAAGMLVTNLV